MNRSFVNLRAASLIGSIVLASATSTRGDVFRDIAYGLGYAGFDIVGQRNVLSGGTDFSISRNFIGSELDFGAWDLTMQGPVAFEVQSGGRGLSELELRLSTAPVGGGTATPLSYLLNVDVGGQEAQITGQLLIDANVTFNGFGFYELDLNYSSRQNVSRDGRFANDDLEFDFDLGPINVSGNIFADALAIVTQPIFDATGTLNPFASFSGRAKLLDAVADTSDAMVAQIVSANAAGNANQSLVVAASFGVPSLVNASFGPLPPAQGGSIRGQGRAIAGVNAAAAAVPEPSVLLLLLLGAPFVIRGGVRFGTNHRRRF